jgi:hypothetical protein
MKWNSGYFHHQLLQNEKDSGTETGIFECQSLPFDEHILIRIGEASTV